MAIATLLGFIRNPSPEEFGEWVFLEEWSELEFRDVVNDNGGFEVELWSHPSRGKENLHAIRIPYHALLGFARAAEARLQELAIPGCEPMLEAEKVNYEHEV